MRLATSFRSFITVLVCTVLSSLAASGAIAAVSDIDEQTIRYATEPSTGSMVLAALVVIAMRRRARFSLARMT